ncbi:MAG: hypothetical protein ABI399_01615, partial [Bauldia sp.]
MVLSSLALFRRDSTPTLVDSLIVRTRRLRACSQPFCSINLAVTTPDGLSAVTIDFDPRPD